MKLTTGQRRTGRTYKLLYRLLYDDNATLVVHNVAERERLCKEVYKLMGFPHNGSLEDWESRAFKKVTRRIVTLDAAKTHLAGEGHRQVVLVDNAEFLFYKVLGAVPEEIVMTDPPPSVSDTR